jgi:hypothetical protein
MSTHATFLSKCRRRHSWTSNARTNLRTKKESWPNMLPDRRACARRSMAHLAKMPLLQLPNCQRSFAAEAALGRILPSPSIEQLPRLPYQWTEADKAVHPSWKNALPASGHSRWLAHRWAGSPFGGNAQYIGPHGACQTSCKIDSTPVQLAGKGVIREFSAALALRQNGVKLGNFVGRRH